MRTRNIAPRAGEYLFGTRVFLDFLALPARLRRHSLPGLLDSLSACPPIDAVMPDPQRAAQIASRIARMRVFRMSLFPRLCLRRSLVLFGRLRHMGWPAEFVIGVLSDRGALRAHSWVTLNGKALLEPPSTSRYRTVYTYPLEASGIASDSGEIWLQKLAKPGSADILSQGSG